MVVPGGDTPFITNKSNPKGGAAGGAQESLGMRKTKKAQAITPKPLCLMVSRDGFEPSTY